MNPGESVGAPEQEGELDAFGRRVAALRTRAGKEDSYRLPCLTCGKSVSTPLPFDAIVRAVTECPECYEIRAAAPQGAPGGPKDLEALELVDAIASDMSGKGPLRWLNHDDQRTVLAAHVDTLIAEVRKQVATVSRQAEEIERLRSGMLAAVDAEEELSGPMPDELWLHLQLGRNAAMDAMRAIVVTTKRGIRERLRALTTAPAEVTK